MSRYRFTDAPMPCGMRMVELPCTQHAADGPLVAKKKPSEATREERAAAHREVRRLDELRMALIEQKGRRAGQLRQGVTWEQYYAAEDQVKVAQKWVDDLAFFWEDAAPEPTHAERLKTYAAKLRKLWERKS
jgi:hypothetical protein